MRVLASIILAIIAIVTFPACSSVGEEASSPRSSSQPSSRGSLAFVELTIQKCEYRRGFFEVVGVAKNTGTEGAFSPTIILRIYDDSGQTLLADDTAWPAGQYLSTMEPGTAAAFQMFTSVPGEPSSIRYTIEVKEFRYDRKYVGECSQ